MTRRIPQWMQAAIILSVSIPLAVFLVPEQHALVGFGASALLLRPLLEWPVAWSQFFVIAAFVLLVGCAIALAQHLGVEPSRARYLGLLPVVPLVVYLLIRARRPKLEAEQKPRP